MRLIDADKIPWLNCPMHVEGFQTIKKMTIDAMPTVDAEPIRHGKWIDIDSQTYTWKVRCDQCGHDRSMMSTQGRYPKYCENCGSKMDAQEDEE